MTVKILGVVVRKMDANENSLHSQLMVYKQDIPRTICMDDVQRIILYDFEPGSILLGYGGNNITSLDEHKRVEVTLKDSNQKIYMLSDSWVAIDLPDPLEDEERKE